MREKHTRWAIALLLVGAGFVTAAEQAAPTTSGAESVAPKSEAQTLLESLPAWLRNMKISGDFRYRHERADDETKTTERDRHRIRARLLVSSKVNEQVDATIGLASGTNESATNTNQDLTESFSSKDLWLDLAFINYHPAGVEGLNVFAGKIRNLYYNPGNSDLLFDADVNPEGIAATYRRTLAKDVTLFSTFGGYYVHERSTEVDTSLWGIQGGVTCKVPRAEGVSITAGAGYFDYGNVQGQQPLGEGTPNFRGNRSVDGLYANDFNILRGFGEVAFDIAGRPCKLFGDWIVNTDADSGDDTGYLVGAGVGKCKDPGSWAFTYNYRDLEADCEVAAFSESTFAGGGTGVRGHKLAIAYQLGKNCTLGANYMIGKRQRAETTDYDVLLAEVNFKF